MKLLKKCTAFMLSCLLMLSIIIPSFAVQSPVNVTSHTVIALKTANITGEKTEDGYVITCNLLQESSNQSSGRSIGWIVVGEARFRLTLLPDNQVGEVNWRIELDNGDKITKVRGTLVVEKDLLGPINPNYAKFNINERFSGEYSSASNTYTFSFKREDKDYNVNFKWSGFYIYGVRGDYSITNGHRKGRNDEDSKNYRRYPSVFTKDVAAHN